MSFFSGIVDEHDRVHLGGYPAPFRDMLGLRIDEFWPLADGAEVEIELDEPSHSRGSVWSEWIELEGASSLARFAGGDLAGRPAITCNGFGGGLAWYVGTRLDQA